VVGRADVEFNREVRSLVSPSDEWAENAAAGGRWPQLRLAEPWKHRELVFFFALRDVKVRYKQAFLGVGWAALQPLAGALVFTLVFHGLADLESEGAGYFVFTLVGFVIWTYYSTSVSRGTASLLVNGELLTKVAFPKIVAPVATMLPGLVDLAVGLALGLVISLVSGGFSVVGLLIGLPLGLALLLLAAVGPATLLSASVVKYRDIAILVTFALQLLLFASPVAYPPETVPEEWRVLQYMNPVAGSLSLIRWGTIGTEPASVGLIGVSFASGMLFLLAGLMYFRSNEPNLVDVI
jgi:ABC-type polysaccharide/polyol phosphate export permease